MPPLPTVDWYVFVHRRVREEMKVAAQAYLDEEARKKADKEQKLSKYRDSAADAAARTIQQMCYVFSVSGRSCVCVLAVE